MLPWGPPGDISASHQHWSISHHSWTWWLIGKRQRRKNLPEVKAFIGLFHGMSPGPRLFHVLFFILRLISVDPLSLSGQMPFPVLIGSSNVWSVLNLLLPMPINVPFLWALLGWAPQLGSFSWKELRIWGCQCRQTYAMLPARLNFVIRGI